MAAAWRGLFKNTCDIRPASGVNIDEVPEMDRTQFEAALTTEVYTAAWRYAWRLAAGGRGGCQQDAEDLLQEALAQAWRQFGQLRDRGQFKAWLLSIIRTRYLNQLRMARRRPRVEGEPAAELRSGAEEQDLLQLEARAALSRIPEPERELLSLFYLEGLSLEATGVVVGLSARVVRQRLYRARQSLRRAWEQQVASENAALQPGSARRTQL